MASAISKTTRPWLQYSNVIKKAFPDKMRMSRQFSTQRGIANRRQGETGQNRFECRGFSSELSSRLPSADLGRDSIVRSPFPDISIPENLPLHEYMLNEFKKYGNETAMVDAITGRELSYAKLQTMVVKATSALVGMGFGRGSVATMYSANCVEYIVMFLAVGAAGGIVSTVNPLYTVDELQRAVTQVKSELLIMSEELLPTAEKAVRQCPSVKNTVVFGKGDKCRPFSSLFENDMSLFPTNLEINAREDVFAIPFSSGTTGLPKGVMLTHYNLLSNVLQAREPDAMDYQHRRDVLISVLPFFHIYGQVVIALTGLAAGVKIISLPKFDPVMYLESIQKYSVTNMHLVPPLMLFLAKHPIVPKYDLNSVRSVMTGAAPCGEETIKEVMTRFRKPPFTRNGYGMTEASPLTHINPPRLNKQHTVGPVVANTECKIVDVESKKSLGVGESGEILIRGPQIMKGYYDNPKATAETVVDGWLHTGDIGHHDEDGYLIIVDRIKELIKVKGLQVAPAELEAVLVTHEAVADAAVIGKQDERLGEAPVAFVVLKDNFKPTAAMAAELQQFVAGRVAPFKKLAGGIKFRKEIPKAASGKILRRVLKAELNS